MKFKYRITAEVVVSRSIEIEVTSLKQLAEEQRARLGALEFEIKDCIHHDPELSNPRVHFEQISLRPTDRKS